MVSKQPHILKIYPNALIAFRIAKGLVDLETMYLGTLSGDVMVYL